MLKIHYIFSWVLGVAVLTACNGSMTNAPYAVPLARTISRPLDSGKTWMSPEAKGEDLVYLSVYELNAVYVYDYRTGKRVGVLTGFDVPSGQCVDAKGDIWITSTKAGSVVEYAHGGSDPIATLQTSGEPIGCSIDPTTGDLAVTNFSYGYGLSSLDVWHHASGNPKIYSTRSCVFMWSPGYDNLGNVYAECQDGAPPGQVWELEHGGSKLKKVSIDKQIGAAAGVMWDGKYVSLAVQGYSGQEATQIYQAVAKTPGHLSVVHKTYLKDTCWDHSDTVVLIQPFIVGTKNTPENKTQGTVVVGGNRPCNGRFDYWKYARGGEPKSELKDVPGYVAGQSVSLVVH